MLIRLIYVSRASSSMPLELRDILAFARKHNPTVGLTGALCLINGVYLQYLEGEEKVVDALYQKIEKDSRHSASKIIKRNSVLSRAFPTWSMALLTWNEETKDIFLRFNPGSELDAYIVNPATAEKLMQSWAATPSWMTV